MTALGFAVRAPERVRTLVVAGIAPEREPTGQRRPPADGPGPDRARRPVWAAELADTLDPSQGPGAWQRLLPAIAEDVAVQPLLTAGELRSIAAPTLVVCGDRDPLVPVGQAWQLARQVRDGRLLVVPDSGHDVLARRPGLVNDALLELLSFDRAGRSPARRRQIGDAPMTTLLALYRRPDGGPEAQATFERRYAEEHLPLVAATPGLRGRAHPPRDRHAPRRDATSSSSPRCTSTTGPPSTPASPPTRCAPRAGTCARSRRAWPRSSSSRTCPNWTPRVPRPWILSGRQPRSAVTDTASSNDPPTAKPVRRDGSSASRSRRPRRPPPVPRRRRPASRSSRSTGPRRSTP